jgi:hypothetical protein
MGNYVVTGPDGKRYKVSGPGTAQEAMAQVQQQAQQNVSTASDVRQTVPAALRRGTEALIGFPGEVNNFTTGKIGQISRALFGDKATDTAAGYVPAGLKSKGYTTEDVQAQTDPLLGKGYQPKTETGKYVGAVTEQVPGMAIGGETLWAKLAAALGSGVAGQFASEHTDNPYVKAGAQILGGAAGFHAPGAAATQTSRAAARDANIAALDAEGIPMTSGQRTGSKTAQYMETELGGSRYGDFVDRQRSGFTDATMRRLGEPGGPALPEDIARARANIGRRFDDLAASTLTPFDPILQNRLLNTAQDYAETAPQVAPVVENMMNRMGEMSAHNGGQLTGQNYQELTTRLRELGDQADGPTANALDAFRGTLDDAVERTLSGDQLDQWRQARQQWANLNTVRRSMTGAGVEAASGQVDPGRLRSAISGGGNGPAAIAEGRSNLTDLANAGVGVMKDTPGNSGSAGRVAARAIPALAGSLGAHALTGGDLMATGAAGMAGLAAPELVGRAVMSPLGQSALLGPSENQRMLLALMMAGRPGLKDGQSQGSPQR